MTMVRTEYRTRSVYPRHLVFQNPLMLGTEAPHYPSLDVENKALGLPTNGQALLILFRLSSPTATIMGHRNWRRNLRGWC